MCGADGEEQAHDRPPCPITILIMTRPGKIEWIGRYGVWVDPVTAGVGGGVVDSVFAAVPRVAVTAACCVVRWLLIIFLGHLDDQATFLKYHISPTTSMNAS